MIEQVKTQNLFAVLFAGGLCACAASSWYPDRADYVFVSNRSGDNEIYVVDTARNMELNISNDPAGDNWPEWSPDGSKILFQSQRFGNLDVFVVDADGSNLLRLTDDPAHDYVPSWSPDGKEIFFLSWRREHGESEEAPHFYAMQPDGGGQSRIISASPNGSGPLTLSPDGASAAYIQRDGAAGSRLVIHEFATGSSATLAESAISLDAPSWSPDGKQIAYYEDDGAQSNIWTISPDGTQQTKITRSGRFYYPRWSPDSRWLIVTVSEAGDDSKLTIAILRADGTQEPVRLINDEARNVEGRWRP